MLTNRKTHANIHKRHTDIYININAHVQTHINTLLGISKHNCASSSHIHKFTGLLEIECTPHAPTHIEKQIIVGRLNDTHRCTHSQIFKI